MARELEVTIAKAKSRIDINVALLSISFLLFTLIVTINPELLSNKPLLAAELTLTIPLLITSALARTKNIDPSKKRVWDKFGFVTYTIAYGFLISVIGIFLGFIVSAQISLIFFGANILMALLYSVINIASDKKKVLSRFYKDSLFILILIIFGVLPSLGVY